MLLLVAIVLSEELLDRIMGISLTVSMMEVLREMNLSAGFVDKIKYMVMYIILKIEVL